jgi:hypothetical protein
MKFNQQLERGIQLGLLVLVALMPFHAFASVALGHAFGHQPAIQAWKEALLAALAVAAAVLVWRDRSRLDRLRQPWLLLAAGFAAVALMVTGLNNPPLTAVAFGLKTDLEFLLAAALAVTVGGPRFIRQLVIAILAGAGVVALFALAQAYLLPPDFLTRLGYGRTTIQPYQFVAPGVSDLKRFPSTLGGANQLGTYLILPICLSLALAFRRRPWLVLLTIACVGALVVTYSRSAWIGAAAAAIITLVLTVPAHWRRPTAAVAAILVVAALAALPFAAQHQQLQYSLLHASTQTHSNTTSSDSEHAESLTDGFQADVHQPLGHGLGTAGPATFRTGSTNIIEDYFLQVGYETGIIGLLLFIGLLVLLVLRLLRTGRPTAAATAASLIGISLAGLVLPSFTDSSTALINFTLAGALAAHAKEHHV